jgi:methylglutaconyl-CoA hydratase
MRPDSRQAADVTAPPAVHYSSSSGVATLTMDQPHNRNALSAALRRGLADGLDAAVADRAVRVVVLTHTGPVFCAGADISEGGGAPTAEDPRVGLAGILAALQDSPKPVVGRIAGHCLGGGVGLAAACDLSVAAQNAMFGFTEVRIGVVPAVVSVVTLSKLRVADALELFLTGERVPAQRAAAVGLITRAVPAAELDHTVAGLVAQLLAGGPAALALAKRLVFEIPPMNRADAFQWTSALSESVFASAEAAEGMAAFREKRPPSWHPTRGEDPGEA